MGHFRGEAELRQYVEKRIGGLSEAIWGLLKEDSYVSEALYEDYFDAVDNLLERARRLKQLEGRPARQTVTARRTFPPSNENAVRARLLAVEAAKHPLVRRFRRKYLPGGLLSPQDVTAWIEERAKEDGPPSLYVTVAVARDVHRGKDLKAVIADDARIAETALRLMRWVDADGSERSLPIADGGTLHYLQDAAHHLAGELGIDDAQAATFILTGRPPVIYPLTVHRSVTFSPAGVRGVIVISADAETPPAQITRVYSAVRREIVRGKRRPLSAHTLEMVSFRLDHLGMTWEECRQAWNAEHPDRTYPSFERMRRDYHRAVKRLRMGIVSL